MNETDPLQMAGDTASPSTEPPEANIIGLVNEIRELAHDHLELATLEAKLSVNTLLRMAVISIVTALVLVSAWLALVGSAALGLIGIGLSPAIAMLILAAANLLLALVGWLRIRHLSHWLGWPATQRAIKPVAANEQKQGAQ